MTLDLTTLSNTRIEDETVKQNLKTKIKIKNSVQGNTVDPLTTQGLGTHP